MLKEEFLIRILACFVLSFLVGIERQYRRRSVGLRTTILVSMGAFLYVCFSFYVHEGDLTRIAAQVVTGIGFLGAGVIIKDGINVRGLTTAATLWCDAAIGILCTGGFLFEAIVGTLIVLFANIILRFINQKLKVSKGGKIIYNRYVLKLKCTDNSDLVKDKINNIMSNKKIIVNGIENSILDNGQILTMICFDLEEAKSSLVNDIVRSFEISKEVLSFSLNKEEAICEIDEEEL